jgi:hypothetical protein
MGVTARLASVAGPAAQPLIVCRVGLERVASDADCCRSLPPQTNLFVVAQSVLPHLPHGTTDTSGIYRIRLRRLASCVSLVAHIGSQNAHVLGSPFSGAVNGSFP